MSLTSASISRLPDALVNRPEHVERALEGSGPARANMSSPARRSARVLVQLGGIPLWGQERGNIQVFTGLKEVGVDALFVTHKHYGHEVIQPALDRLQHKWIRGTYPKRIGRHMTVRQWLERLGEIALGNWDFFRAGQAYQATHIHVCNEGHFLTLLPAIRALRVPVIFRLGDEPRQHTPFFRKLWRRAIIPSVSQFVCVSEFIREKLLAAGAPPERVRVIYSYPQERMPLRPGERLGGSSGRINGDEHLLALSTEPFDGRTFVYVGQLNALKGVDLLVGAALRLCRERDDVRFLIAGDYSWQNPFAERLIEEVAAAGVAQRIRFLGYVADVERLLSLGDVHVCPSVWEEPLSNTVVEAKQIGRPSLVFASGGLPELVTTGLDGIVVTDKTEDGLYSALSRAAAISEDRLAEMSGAARSSQQRLGITRDQFIRAWADVYSNE
jgi:glycosyltransferase involved in cell wall biosynthesis